MVEADKPCQDAKKALDEAQTKLKTAKDALDAAIKQNKEESKNKKGGGGGKGGGAGGGRAGY
jgi:exonuclease VII small subunit